MAHANIFDCGSVTVPGIHAGVKEIRAVNLPGPTRTAGVDEFVSRLSGGKSFTEFEEDFFRTVRPTSLLKRFATPEEVAALITYVCSPLSAATNGAALRVDGGIVKACF